MLARARRCPYGRLLRRHCPLPGEEGVAAEEGPAGGPAAGGGGGSGADSSGGADNSSNSGAGAGSSGGSGRGKSPFSRRRGGD